MDTHLYSKFEALERYVKRREGRLSPRIEIEEIITENITNDEAKCRCFPNTSSVSIQSMTYDQVKCRHGNLPYGQLHPDEETHIPWLINGSESDTNSLDLQEMTSLHAVPVMFQRVHGHLPHTAPPNPEDGHEKMQERRNELRTAPVSYRTVDNQLKCRMKPRSPSDLKYILTGETPSEEKDDNQSDVNNTTPAAEENSNVVDSKLNISEKPPSECMETNPQPSEKSLTSNRTRQFKGKYVNLSKCTTFLHYFRKKS